MTPCSSGAKLGDPVLSDPSWLRAAFLTLAVATLGGFIASLIGIPLPWMLGAMGATGLLAWSERAVVPAPTRPVALLLLGLGLGQTFTRPVLIAVASALPTLILAGLLSVLVGLALAPLFARQARTDAKTGFFATVPGGVLLMAVLAQHHGASVPAVTLAQTIRVMVVVVLFPPVIALVAPHGVTGAFSAVRPEVYLPGLLGMMAAGYVFALGVQRIGVANPWMLGPCVLVIILSWFGWLPSGVPLWLIDAAQVGMGAMLGTRMTRRFLLASRRLALAAAASALALSALLAALAFPVAWMSGLPEAAVVLGMAPGGMPEMTITAKALDLAVPLVLGFHLVRQLMCNLLLGPVWRLATALGLVK